MLSSALSVTVSGPDGASVATDMPAADGVVRWAEQHCPVQDALRRAVPCTVESTA